MSLQVKLIIFLKWLSSYIWLIFICLFIRKIRKEKKTWGPVAQAYYKLLHLSVMNQKDWHVRSPWSAVAIFPHLLKLPCTWTHTQSRCRCLSRPQRLLLSVTSFYTAKSQGLAAGNSNHTYRKLLMVDLREPENWSMIVLKETVWQPISYIPWQCSKSNCDRLWNGC